MKCQNCGNEISENQKFCTVCGNKCDIDSNKSDIETNTE